MAGRISSRLGISAVLIAIALIGCGDNEATQRKAFIEFLQSRIIGKSGIHVPKLTADESSAFGDYAKHYAVIAEFNTGLDQQVSKPLHQAVEAGAPRSLEDAVGRRKDIATILGGMAAISTALDRQLAIADAAHAALKQPDDLKPVYDAAYDRDVTQPAKAFAEIFPDAAGAMKDFLEFADFVEQHHGAIRIQGSQIQVSDAALQPQLKKMIDGLSARQEGIQKAQQRLRNLAYGT
jgi:hypothetical protein